MASSNPFEEEVVPSSQHISFAEILGIVGTGNEVFHDNPFDVAESPTNPFFLSEPAPAPPPESPSPKEISPEEKLSKEEEKEAEEKEKEKKKEEEEEEIAKKQKEAQNADSPFWPLDTPEPLTASADAAPVARMSFADILAQTEMMADSSGQSDFIEIKPDVEPVLESIHTKETSTDDFVMVHCKDSTVAGVLTTSVFTNNSEATSANHSIANPPEGETQHKNLLVHTPQAVIADISEALSTTSSSSPLASNLLLPVASSFPDAIPEEAEDEETEEIEVEQEEEVIEVVHTPDGKQHVVKKKRKLKIMKKIKKLLFKDTAAQPSQQAQDNDAEEQQPEVKKRGSWLFGVFDKKKTPPPVAPKPANRPSMSGPSSPIALAAASASASASASTAPSRTLSSPTSHTSHTSTGSAPASPGPAPAQRQNSGPATVATVSSSPSLSETRVGSASGPASASSSPDKEVSSAAPSGIASPLATSSGAPSPAAAMQSGSAGTSEMALNRRRSTVSIQSPSTRDDSLDEIGTESSSLSFDAQLAKRRASVSASNRRRPPTIVRGGSYQTVKNRTSTLFDSGDDTSPLGSAPMSPALMASPEPELFGDGSPPKDGAGAKKAPPPVSKKPPKVAGPERAATVSGSLGAVLARGRPSSGDLGSASPTSPPADSGVQVRETARPTPAAGMRRMSSAVALELNGILAAGLRPGSKTPLRLPNPDNEETES